MIRWEPWLDVPLHSFTPSDAMIRYLDWTHVVHDTITELQTSTGPKCSIMSPGWDPWLGAYDSTFKPALIISILDLSYQYAQAQREMLVLTSEVFSGLGQGSLLLSQVIIMC